ncbi:heat shock 70 kDa protein 12A-like [Saccoglossus kowalevskii]
MSTAVKATVAIDFGTTFSGFAYSNNSHQNRGATEHIYMSKKWGHNRGISTLRTPTCMLLKPDKGFDAFGYDAQEKFASLEGGTDKEYYYLERFKMELHNREKIDVNTELTASNGKRVNALLVFAEAIKFLATEAVEVIRQRSGSKLSKDDIQWILTVPAIWNQASIITRENPRQLMLALEPEAAGLDCRTRSMAEFVDGKSKEKCGDVTAKPGTTYMVIDNGGGTVDITVHRINKDQTIDELHRPTGGAWGGICVEEAFEKLMSDLFGSKFIAEYKYSYPAQWTELMTDFEMKKQSPKLSNEYTRIRFPYDLFTKAKITTRARCRFEADDVKLTGGYLRLSPSVMMGLFEKPVNNITNFVADLLKDRQFDNVTIMFLVGGFSDSPFLRKKFDDKFGSKYKILTPIDASLCVVRGAVLFGQKPEIISTRVSPYTYGTYLTVLFEESEHEERYRYTYMGDEFCDIFHKLVTTGEKVKLGEIRSVTTYPVNESQKTVDIDFYITANKKVTYVNEPHVRKVASVTLESLNTSKGNDRQFKLDIQFGNTEIQATTKDEESGNSKIVFLDFFSHSTERGS